MKKVLYVLFVIATSILAWILAWCLFTDFNLMLIVDMVREDITGGVAAIVASVVWIVLVIVRQLHIG